jgi:hypothetical protein
LAICFSFLDLETAGRRGDLLPFIGTHTRECRLADAQFQEEISFKRKALRQRDEPSAQAPFTRTMLVFDFILSSFLFYNVTSNRTFYTNKNYL